MNRYLNRAVLLAWVSLTYVLLPLPLGIEGAVTAELSGSMQAFDQSEMGAQGSVVASPERLGTLELAIDREVIFIRIAWAGWACLIFGGIIGSVLHTRPGGQCLIATTALIFILAWALNLAHIQQATHNSIFETVGRMVSNLAAGSSSAVLISYIHQEVLLPLFFAYVLLYVTLFRSDM